MQRPKPHRSRNRQRSPTGRRNFPALNRHAAASPCAGGRTGTGHRSSRVRLGTYRRGAYQKGEQKGGEESTGRSHSKRKIFPLAVYRRGTGNAGLSKVYPKIGQAADRLDDGKAAIPKRKETCTERTFDEATGKGKTRLHFEEQEKPIGRISPTITRYPAPHNKRVFSSTTRYIPLKRTIPALRGRTNPKNWQSAAQSTGRGKSRRATTATSLNPTGRRQRQRKWRSRRMWIFSTIKPCMTIRTLRAIPFPASTAEAANQAAVCKVGKERRRKNGAISRREHPQGGKKYRRGNKKGNRFCRAAPGGRMYRRCRATLIHHGIGGAFLLRFHVLRLDERHTWDFLHVGGQRPCGDGGQLRRKGKRASAADRQYRKHPPRL